MSYFTVTKNHYPSLTLTKAFVALTYPQKGHWMGTPVSNLAIMCLYVYHSLPSIPSAGASFISRDCSWVTEDVILMGCDNVQFQ